MEKPKKSRFKLLHQYYKYTGFYRFIWSNTKKAILPLLIVIGVLLYINYKVISINEMMAYITQNFSDISIFSVFFISESFLGLLPPDIFIAWTKSTTSPLLYLSVLAILSYLGGVIAYFMGRSLLLIPLINEYFEGKMSKHIKNMQKWGGFLIIVGALLPIPFSMTSIAAGLIHYKFSNYLLFGLLRFVRFYLYAVVIFNVF